MRYIIDNSEEREVAALRGMKQSILWQNIAEIAVQNGKKSVYGIVAPFFTVFHR